MHRLFRGRRRALILALVAATLVTVLPTFAGSPSPSVPIPPARILHLVAYNIALQDAEPPNRLIESLIARAPAVVGLVEVSDERAAAIADDADLARLYPYQELRPNAAGGGLAILSSLPVEVEPDDRSLPVLRATVDVDGTEVALIVAHAPNPLTSRGRDGVLERLRAMLLEEAAAGRPAILAGDLNTTDFEPAFRRLVEGMVDVPGALGWWPGRTWGPEPGGPEFLRIDHVIATKGVVPHSASVDCDASGSDHCLVEVEVGIPDG